MDIATIIGLVGGTVLVMFAIAAGGDVLIFLNIPGLLIVVGGTVATCFIKFTMADVINSVSVAMKAFMVKIYPPEEIMEKMVSVAKIAKERGLMALENEAPDDPFAAKAFQFLADGFDENQIKELLQKDINLTIQRHITGQKVFKGMGGSAPAFGMIGTLIGLVQMLANMAQSPRHRSGHGGSPFDHTLWGADCQPGLPAPGRQTGLKKSAGTDHKKPDS